MNCDAFTRQLDDYLDGVLSDADARALATHAAACESCARRLAVARELRARAAALPREREPARDLWPGIAARLPEPREEPRRTASRLSQRSWFRALVAGLALMAVFVGGMLADRVLRETGKDATPRSVERQELPSLEEARRVLPASYVELIEGDGSGATEQELLRNLLLVNLAIHKVEMAVAENPANTNLRKLLTGLYAQENRILTQAQRLRVTRQLATRTSI